MSNGSDRRGHRKSRKGQGFVAFPSLTLKAKKPPSPLYPKSLNTIGDHIRKVRLNRGLRQRDVAQIIGVDPFTILNWETGATKPKFRYMPVIIRFLGCNPCPVPPDSPVGVRLKARRLELGLSLKQLAKHLKLNEDTLRKLEAGRSKNPFRKTIEKVHRFLKIN